MASEPTEGETVSVGLPEDLDAWLDEHAEGLGLEPEALFQRLLAAYQVAVTAEEGEVDPQHDVTALADRLDRLEGTHQTDIEDVRRRVLQLKTLTDEKADADHDHDTLQHTDERLAALETDVDDLTAQVDRLAARTTDAEPVEREELADVREKLSRVASAVVALRKDRTREADRSATTPTAPGVDTEAADRLLELKRTAAREGYERAACGACGESSHVHLLPEPACPACGTPFTDLVELGGFRKRPTLVGEGGDGG